MKKQRKYLKDLIPININSLFLETGYYELQIGDIHLSLAPERHPSGKYYVTLFRNNIRQPMQWELSARPHVGRLKNGAQIPYSHDEVFYAVGTDGRRYRHLFIDGEHCRIGVRTDFFANNNAAYREPRSGRLSRTQIEAMGRELFPEDRDAIFAWDQNYKRMRRKLASD